MEHYRPFCFFQIPRLALLCFSTLIGTTALANPPTTLRCLSTVFAPYVIEENGKVTGVDVDVVKEVGRRLGITIEVELKPWVRLEREMESGVEQCAFAYFRTPERLNYMDFTNVPLHITSYTLFVLKDRKLQYKNLADIKGDTVGLNQGFKTTPAFAAQVAQGNIKEFRVEQELQSFQMLNAKRIDAVLTNYFVGAYQIKNLNLSNVTPLFPPLQSTPAYLTFSKKHPLAELVPLFDATLFDVLVDGTYQKIFDSYTKLNSAE